MIIRVKSQLERSLRRIQRTLDEIVFSGCLDWFVPRSDVSATSLRGTNFAPETSGVEGCKKAIFLSMALCKEQTDYHVTSLSIARLFPRNDEAL